jgi:hypothetical protein
METKQETTGADAPLPVIRDSRICLAMPVYGKIDVPFVQCLMAMCQSSTLIQMWDFLPGDSLVNRARNNLAKRFLDGYQGIDGAGNKVTVKHDWMLFLDTDLIFRPEDVQKVYDLGMKHGPGVYAGVYPIKQLKPKIVFNNMPNCVPDAEGIVEVREAGTGFMLIHREVFEKMIEKYGDEIKYSVDMGDANAPATYSYDFFSVGVWEDTDFKPHRKRFLSEDWYFCQRWRKMGGKILMHTRTSCNHIGTFNYPGDPKAVMEAAEFYKKGFDMMANATKPTVVKVGPPDKYEPKPEAAPVAVAV